MLWSGSYDRALTTGDIFDLEAELAASIAGHLAQPYGVIPEAAAKGLGEGRPESLTAYDCVQRALAYRLTFAKELYPPVRSCLEQAVGSDPGYADAWALLAFAHLDAARYGLVEPAARAGEMAAGVEAALRAAALAPDRVRPWQALAALRFAGGEYDEAERVQRRAIALNPDNPESLAQLGWRLMARGRWDEGAAYLRDAIDRSVRVPAWYYSTLASALYLKGDLARALDAAELGKGDCCGIGYAVLAIAEAAAGHPAEARAALDEALRAGARPGARPAGVLGQLSGARTRSSTGSTRAWPWRGSRRRGRQRGPGEPVIGAALSAFGSGRARITMRAARLLRPGRDDLRPRPGDVRDPGRRRGERRLRRQRPPAPGATRPRRPPGAARSTTSRWRRRRRPRSWATSATRPSPTAASPRASSGATAATSSTPTGRTAGSPTSRSATRSASTRCSST